MKPLQRRSARDGSKVEGDNMDSIALTAAMDGPGDAEEGNNCVDRGRRKTCLPDE